MEPTTLVDDDHFGHGLSELLELQRQANETHDLMFRHMQLTAPEDPVERLRRLVKEIDDDNDNH